MDAYETAFGKKNLPVRLAEQLMETDNYLLHRIINEKDKLAAEKLISRYYKYIYKIIFVKIGEEELAKDLTQETFVAVLRGLKGFDDSKASFKTWIATIAKNKIIDYSRSRQYHESLLTDVLEDYEREDKNNLENTIINKAISEKLDKLLSLEDELTSQIVNMKLKNEFSFVEISEKLNINISLVKNRYYAFMKKLRKEMKDYE